MSEIYLPMLKMTRGLEVIGRCLALLIFCDKLTLVLWLDYCTLQVPSCFQEMKVICMLSFSMKLMRYVRYEAHLAIKFKGKNFLLCLLMCHENYVILGN